MALRWEDVELADGTVHVTRGSDEHQEPRAPAGADHGGPAREPRRPTPTPDPGVDLVFGLGPGRPFDPQKAQARADDGWAAAGLDRLTFHDCRHTFASFAIAAGVNAKALSIYLGHSSGAITFDRYGHLMPGSENEAAGLLDAYLADGS
ncbi:MAG: tyrosine-type recombinase/integrase [Actinomycetota bacterium]|nr:tyrosine-type recombinase/integrase [Actinomycetota bacterium]